MAVDKAREARIRRAAERRGLLLRRSRRRDPGAPDYGLYQLVDSREGWMVLTGTIDEIEAWLNRDRQPSSPTAVYKVTARIAPDLRWAVTTDQAEALARALGDAANSRFLMPTSVRWDDPRTAAEVTIACHATDAEAAGEWAASWITRQAELVAHIHVQSAEIAGVTPLDAG